MLNLEINNKKIESFFHNSKEIEKALEFIVDNKIVYDESQVEKILQRRKEAHQNLIDSNVKRGALKELFEDLEND